MNSERRTIRNQKFVIGGLIGALALSVCGFGLAGVALAGNSPPATINTCTKVTKGVYGATKVTKGSACKGTGYFQTWSQQPGSLISTQPGWVTGSDGNVWLVVVPASNGPEPPTGTLSLECEFNGPTPGGPFPITDSGGTQGVLVLSGESLSSPISLEGVLAGGGSPATAESNYLSQCGRAPNGEESGGDAAGNYFYYSGDSSYASFLDYLPNS